VSVSLRKFEFYNKENLRYFASLFDHALLVKVILGLIGYFEIEEKETTETSIN